MTTVDSVKSQVKNKKGKHWMYFSKHGKKSKSIQDPSASTKPSGTDGTALPHEPGNHPRKAHLKKRKRKGKPQKSLENSIKAEKDEQKVSNESSSASSSTYIKKIATKAASERTNDCAGQDHAARGASNTSKAKQLRKKMKRKLKILKRKEKKKTMTGSTGISSNDQDKLVTSSTTKKSKRTSEQTKSYKTSSATSDKELDRDTSKGDKSRITSKALSRKRIRNGELDTTETKKKKKKQGTNDTVDSGMSSGNDETPQLPEEPQDVASNWKALATKLKASAPKNPKPKTKNRNASDKAVEKKEHEIWFDDVDPALLDAEKGSSEHNASDSAGAYQGNNKITKCVALDCEMVGTGHEGKESILARVSMVNEYGHCIYDKFVKPREKVTDFRTEFSGVRPKDLFKGNAEEFLTVQKEVADIMKDRVLVGHALKNDMKVLFLGQPRRLIRDTASYPHFRELMKTKRPALKKLAKTVLGVTVQEGEHNSVEDAQTAMRLYTLHRTAWEKSLKQRGKITKK